VCTGNNHSFSLFRKTNALDTSPHPSPSLENATPLPSAHVEKPLVKRWWFWLLLVGSALVALIFFDLAILKISETEDTKAALDACREQVTSRAKYPGGVSFPEDIDIQSSDSITDSPRRYYAFGHVDFPNGFGTPVREFYSCNIVVDLGDIQDSTVHVAKDPLR
jgi:hypothetical protein